MMEENPYAAPLTDQVAPAESERKEFADLDFKELKKLRNHSHSIGCLGVLWSIGAVIILSLFSFLLLSIAQRGMLQISLTMILMSFGALGLIAAIGCFQRGNWARIVGIIFCCFHLIHVPIGTLIGILGIIAFAQGGRLFGDGRLEHYSLEREFKYRKNNKIR